MWKRIRRGLAILVGLYMGWMYVRNGWMKFDPQGFWTAPFERWGYPVWLRLAVGVIETAGGLMIVVPWVATYGSICLIVVMIGAWFTRLGSGYPEDVIWITIYILGLAWIAFEWWGMRRPKLEFWYKKSRAAEHAK
jgi:uncharacterized membrane protein YphA (DoxX/SURF4 family)